MLLLLVSDVAREAVVRVRSARDVEAEVDVEPCAVAGQAHQQRAHSFQPVRHHQVSRVQRAQPEALDERRHARLGPRVVAGDEHVQRAALGQDVAEDGVERLLAGTALAISCAPEMPSGVISPVASALKVLEMSMMTLPASASPYWATTGTALAYGTARMTMSPTGAVPNVPAVAPPPSAAARSLALAGSRPITSTALPPSTARVPMAVAMLPD